jgi:hypothetical protein
MDYAVVGQAVSRFRKRLDHEPALLRQITKIPQEEFDENKEQLLCL